MTEWWYVVVLLATNATTALSIAAIHRHAAHAAIAATDEFRDTLGIAHAEFGRLVVLLDRLENKLAAKLERIETGAETDREAVAGVAQDLTKAKLKVERVAGDLADSHQRADDTTGPYGAAGDAAARTSGG